MRLGALALSTAMAVSLLTGCSGGNNSSTGGTSGANSTASNTSTSSSAEENQEVTTLTWYMSINPVAADTEEVIAALNEYTREKINVEIDYKVIANPD